MTPEASGPPPTERAARSTRWLPWAVYLGGATLLTFFDVRVADSLCSGLVFVLITAYGVVVLLRRSNAGFLGASSLAGTVVIVTVGYRFGANGTFGLGEAFVLTVALAISFRRAATLTDWVQTAVVIVALLCLPIRIWSPDAGIFTIALIAPLGCALAAGAVLKNLDTQRRLAVAVATREERDGLARELHDEITNHVTNMVLRVQSARGRSETIHSELEIDLAGAEAAGADALRAMRSWVTTLRQTNVELNPELRSDAAEDIRALVDRWQSVSATRKADLTMSMSAEFRPELKSAIFRIVQEAVTNVSRHSPDADWLKVDIDDTHRLIRVQIVSPLSSRHTDPAPGSTHLGILGMTERARLLGGTVTAGPVEPSCWSVVAVIPRGTNS